MSIEHAQRFFETAYKTGSDVWTHIPYLNKGSLLTKKLSRNSLILDIGSGRGLWAFHLVSLGYRVIGLDTVGDLVTKTNEEVKNHKLIGRARFIAGSALDIPLTDESFDAVTDFGLLQHLAEEEQAVYARELLRVLKPGGYLLLVMLSKETRVFLGFSPKESVTGIFDKEDIHYHFFTEEGIEQLFGDRVQKIESHTEYIDKDTVYVSVLFQKK